MKQLAYETIRPANKGQSKTIAPEECSAHLIEVAPLIIRRIRSELRQHTMQGLTIPQFRTLNYLGRHPNASLSDLAEHLALTPPTVSKLVQKLVDQEIVERSIPADRRRVCLSLTKKGVKAITSSREKTRQQLANSLKSLSQEELTAMSVALEVLERVFSGSDASGDIL